MSLSPRWVIPTLLLTVAGVAVVLYWPILSIPNIYDTLLHIRITGGLDWRTVWWPTSAFGFYRPLTFVPLLIVKELFGYYPAWVFNSLNLGQHALDATLLTALVWRLWSRTGRALAAGLLFATFPFAYQAVAVYGHNVHPAIAGVFLLALHTSLSALRAPTPQAWKWWALTGALFVVGVITHESVVMLGLFIGLMHGPEAWRHNLHQRRVPGWAWLLMVGAIYIASYRFLPISRTPQSTFEDNGSMVMRLLYFAQAAAYPFTWLARWLRTWSAPTLILSGLSLTVALTAWAARPAHNRWPLLMGWGWWAASAALLTFSLQTDYLLHGPRLLYLSSIGLAIAWAVMLEGLATSRTGRVLGTLALSVILLTSSLFVRARLADYARLTAPLTVIQNSLADQPTDVGLLLINLPDWLSPAANQYPVGAEFVSMLGPYLFAEEWIDHNLGGHYVTQAIALSDVLTPAAYPYGVHDQTPYDQLHWGTDERDWHVFITNYTAAGPHTRHTGWLTAPMPPTAPIATFGPYQLKQITTTCASPFTITLVWQTTVPTSEITPNLAMFVHVLDSNAQLLGQADGPPLGLRPQLVPSVGGRLIHDVRDIDIGAGSPTQVRLGVYDFGADQRLMATDAQGQPLADNIFYTPITPCP